MDCCTLCSNKPKKTTMASPTSPGSPSSSWGGTAVISPTARRRALAWEPPVEWFLHCGGKLAPTYSRLSTTGSGRVGVLLPKHVTRPDMGALLFLDAFPLWVWEVVAAPLGDPHVMTLATSCKKPHGLVNKETQMPSSSGRQFNDMPPHTHRTALRFMVAARFTLCAKPAQRIGQDNCTVPMHSVVCALASDCAPWTSCWTKTALLWAPLSSLTGELLRINTKVHTQPY